MNKQISKYVVGMEKLDNDYKPLEHIDTWSFEELTKATDKYNTLCCALGENAKYLKVIFRDKTEIILESWGYYEKRQVYTIEYGFVDDDNEKINTNEEQFLSKKDYEKVLKEIFASAIGNTSHKGFYAECYLDEEILSDRDLESIKNYHCMEDCAKKCHLIQQFIIDTSGECIDYAYKD